jgi:hypothetical protein
VTEPPSTEPSVPRFTIPLWVWVLTLAALLFFALTLWQAQKLQRQLAELQLQMRLEQGRKETLEAQRREMDEIRALLAAPETRAVQLKPAAVEATPFKIFWNEALGILVTAQNVRALPAGRVFQLWILPKKGSAISAGVFQPDANGTLLTLLRPAAPIRMHNAAGLMITVEPDGGSLQPDSEPSWVGKITQKPN